MITINYKFKGRVITMLGLLNLGNLVFELIALILLMQLHWWQHYFLQLKSFLMSLH